MLNPLEVKVWDDTIVVPGDKWTEKIDKALASTEAAILLVIPDFLELEFIRGKQLILLLEAAQNEGCRILWINVKDSVVKATSIGQFKALYGNNLLIA